jgi:hypothetical protein
LQNVSGNWIATDFGQFTGNNFSTFGEDAAGNLYIAGLTSGTIYRISDSPATLIQTPKTNTVSVTYLLASGKVTIESTPDTGNEVQFTAYNTIGVPCITTLSKKSIFTIDISTLPKGIYFLNILSGGQHIIRKVIKE